MVGVLRLALLRKGVVRALRRRRPGVAQVGVHRPVELVEPLAQRDDHGHVVLPQAPRADEELGDAPRVLHEGRPPLLVGLDGLHQTLGVVDVHQQMRRVLLEARREPNFFGELV